MFQSLNLLGLCCLLFTVTSQGGQILQPQNVSLVWLSEFEPQLTWADPHDSMKHCKYEVQWPPDNTETIKKPNWTVPVQMNGGSFSVSVKTVCGTDKSAPVDKRFTYPEMVRDLECNIHSSIHTRCSWIPVSPYTPSFYYQILNRSGDSDRPLLACSKHTDSKGRAGCDLHAEIIHNIRILFNETRDNKTYRNIFYKEFQVKPPALNWTVTKTKDSFFINWTPPDFGSGWKFIINYTECNENKRKDVSEGTSVELPIVPHCPYNMTMKAQLNNGETPWSTPYSFEADTNSNMMLAATIVTPLLIASLAALLFVCWRKNKNSIFPKVPKPRDLLSDIADNNNKSNVPSLYIPAEEEENCKITLVVDPQNNKLHS